MNKIAIHSVPRSGSTWLGSIFNSHPNVIYKYQPLFSYALKGYLNENSTKEDIDRFYKLLADTQDDFMDEVSAKQNGIVPEFNKSTPNTVVYKEVRYHHILRNLLMSHPEIKVVGLIRNPLSTLYSWLQAPREFRSDLGWKFEDEWYNAPTKNLGKKEEFNGYLKWKEVALLFNELKLNFKEQFYLCRYIDLLNNTNVEIENLFRFCQLDMTTQTNEFITRSKTNNVSNAYGVYKLKVNDDDWKGNLPNSIIKYIIDDLTGGPLEVYLS